MKARGPRARFYGVYGQTPTVYAASGIGTRLTGTWYGSPITPAGEGDGLVQFQRSRAQPIGGGPSFPRSSLYTRQIGPHGAYGPIRPYGPTGMGMTEVRAASGIPAGTPGNWWSRTITPYGEVQHSEYPVSRNWSHAIGGGPIKKDARYWSHPIGQNPDNSALRPLGAIDDMAEEFPAPATEPVVEEPAVPPTPISFMDPGVVPRQEIIAGYSDQELTNILNESIAEGWRIKGCKGPYCMVQANRNREIRLALLTEYRSRQAQRAMPPLVEPQHTLAYSRYKLSKTVLSWADQTLTARLLWPVKVYMKAGATALEDIVGSEYLTIFIMTSPLVGIYALRQLGYTGLWSLLIGGYLGMTLGAMLPMTLFGLSQALGAAEEKDFLWAIS